MPVNRRQLLKAGAIGAVWLLSQGLGAVFAGHAGSPQNNVVTDVSSNNGVILHYDGTGDSADLSRSIESLSRGKPLFVMYYATWCGPCKTMTRNFETLVAGRNGGFTVLKVDVDRFPGLANAAGIRATPTTRVFLDGNEAASRIFGPSSVEALDGILQRLQPQRRPDTTPSLSA